MNDDELIESLRRTLRSRAAAVRPKNIRIHDVPASAIERTPRRLRPSRRAMALAGFGLAAASAITTVALAASSSHHSRVSVVGNPASTSSVQTSPAPTNAPPSTAPPSTAATATTSPPATLPSLPPVPAGFLPVSATFISPRSAWALGTRPCGSSLCAAVARTFDAGAHWGSLGAPPITLPGQPSAGSVTIRFLNGDDGWIVAPEGNHGSSQLWYTIDGGRTWQSGPVPGGSTATVATLEAAQATVHALVAAPGGEDLIYSSAPGLPKWTQTGSIARGGGPAPTGEIVLFGSTGWIVANDRTTSGGARLTPDGKWTPWSPPCMTANGPGLVAASSAADLFVLCDEGAWGPSQSHLTGNWLFASTDGGKTFTKVASVPGDGVSQLTAAADDPTRLVAATSAGLEASFDGGRSWSTVYPTAAGFEVTFVGYTTGTQAVAIIRALDGSSSSLALTQDGGHTWSTATF